MDKLKKKLTKKEHLQKLLDMIGTIVYFTIFLSLLKTVDWVKGQVMSLLKTKDYCKPARVKTVHGSEKKQTKEHII